MALIDMMKGKVSQAGQSTVKLARDFSETTRLNSEISAAQNQINDLYREIGYKIYCTYRANPLPEVADLILQTNALHNKIENNQAQIASINAANHCPSCGTKIKPGMSFCSSCGTKLVFEQRTEPIQEQAPLFCQNCGARLVPGVAFCTSCGSKIE